MNKPTKPQKPSKNSSPPSNYELVEKVIMTNFKTKEIVLLSIEEHEKVNPGEDWPAWEAQNLETKTDNLTYKEIIKIKDLLGEKVEDFSIEEESYDGYTQHMVVSFRQLKPPGQYQKEIILFGKRFENYEKQMQKYLEEMKKYEELKKKDKIARLQKELAEITVKSLGI